MRSIRKLIRHLAIYPEIVSSQYLGVMAGLAPAQAGNRKGLPLHFEKIPEILGVQN